MQDYSMYVEGPDGRDGQDSDSDYSIYVEGPDGQDQIPASDHSQGPCGDYRCCQP